MRFLAVLFLSLAVVSFAAPFVTLSEQQHQFLFTKWVQQHSKSYEANEFFSRFAIFQQNMNKILLHNAGNSSFTLGMNEFGDLTWEEFRGRFIGGVRNVKRDYLRSLNHPEPTTTAPPVAIDWRYKNAVTAVKNQGQCGSCWAFSTTGSTEGAWAIAGHGLVSLSEQQLVDCSAAQGNQGCNGGLMDQGFEYIIQNKGLCTEDSYPYTAADGTCQNSCEKVATLSSYKDVPANDEKSLLTAAAIGPVSVAIEADQEVFQFYSSGVLDDSGCGTNLDHGVLVVGYGIGDKDYWIVKNSWGSSWGESGYLRMARGKNECGISLSASYPIV